MGLKQNGVFTFVITSGRTDSTLRTQPTLVAEQVTAHCVGSRFAARGHCTAAEDASLLQAAAEREDIYLRPSDPSLVQFLSGAVASSAVSSVLHLRDAAGNHGETRTGAYTHCGDAASFHEREFRTRLRIAGKTCDQHIEALSKVCDVLRGDAFVAAQQVGFDNLCEVIGGKPRGIDTLVNHVRGMVFP